MKKLTWLLLILLNAKFSQGQICDGEIIFLTQVGQCDNNPWVLVFEDNFNSSLNLSKWNLPYQGVLRDFNHDNEKQWYTNTGNTPSLPISNNILISDGTIKLITKRQSPPLEGTYISDYSTNPWTYKTEFFDFSSAEIDTKYKFGYGMYEINCKIPKGMGFWPAFWMFGNGLENENNEIDVYEFWKNNTQNLNMTVHYNGKMCLTDNKGPDYSQAFHTYTVIWDNYKIEWYVDGIRKRVSSKFYTILGQSIECNELIALNEYLIDKVFPKDPMNIIANLALQVGEFQPNANTPLPSSLEIDYIKYYKKIECLDTIFYDDISKLNLSNQEYNFTIGKTITLGGNFELKDVKQLEIVASNYISLNPGFSVSNGCDFIARIDPTICNNKKK